jgi:fumarylacetoacetase
MTMLDVTNDPKLRSRVDSANDPTCEFPIQNLPFGIFSNPSEQAPRMGVAIGHQIAELAQLVDAGLLADPGATFWQPTLNAFIALGQPQWRAVRSALSVLLAEGGPALPETVLVAQSEVKLHLPLSIGGYTDFYSSLEHAEAGGRIFRGPAAQLPPQYRELPIAYNGRASSIVVSETPIPRPLGQARAAVGTRSRLAPTAALDFELEMAFVVGAGNDLGHPILVDAAEDHIFGLVLLNDWSARDHQRWESVPLGPFNAKGFATTISPWVVTLDALAPFRCAAPPQAPIPLEYLVPSVRRGFDIQREARILPAGSGSPVALVRTNHRCLYRTIAQQLAHHTIVGCNMRVGDLCGSGTISGPAPESAGSLLERTFNGAQPVAAGAGLTRGYLEAGDVVDLTGWCQGEGYRVGFGRCSGMILPAIAPVQPVAAMETL